MNPFRYPEGKHSRTQNPGPFRDYKRYKPFLRLEFLRQCIYCRMPDGFRGEAFFGVDHYRPKRRFPSLVCEYSNLFYSCNTCNSRKGEFWPSDQQWDQGFFIPNPCDHGMLEHLSYIGARVEPKTRAGQFAIDVLLLNEPEDVQYREFVLRSIERCLSEAEAVLQTLVELTSRVSVARDQELEELRLDIANLRTDFEAIQNDLERLTGARLQGPERQ